MIIKSKYQRKKRKRSPVEVDMESVSNALKRAKEYGLETEVVLWSLYSMRGSPKNTIAKALWEGLYEWDV